MTPRDISVHGEEGAQKKKHSRGLIERGRKKEERKLVSSSCVSQSFVSLVHSQCYMHEAGAARRHEDEGEEDRVNTCRFRRKEVETTRKMLTCSTMSTEQAFCLVSIFTLE